MTTKRNTKIPRHFSFEGIGEGEIIEEATVDEYEDWAPAIQLLKFTDGVEALRFCYYVKSGQIARRGLWIDDENADDLREKIKYSPKVKEFLQRLLNEK